MFKLFLSLSLSFIACFFLLFADTVPTTTGLSITINSIHTLGLSGASQTMTISAGTPGVSTLSTTASGSTYAYTTNDTATKKITGVIDIAMPSNTTLSVTLEAPAGATSLGSVTLGTSPVSLVQGIPGKTLASGLAITYTFAATTTAGSLAPFSRLVTFTLADQ